MGAKPKRIRFWIAMLVVVGCAGGGLAAVVSSGGKAAKPTGADPASAHAPASQPAVAGSTARFAFLARQTTNSCGLQSEAITAMSDRMRLEGSCCSPMDRGGYKSQIHGLYSYRAIAQIPSDPYDVPVSLAKRLFAYDHAIRLTPAQGRTYTAAMRMSKTKGPCCCHCWRWNAFRGLSRYLITDRRWRAAAVARVIDLVEGCGGPAA